MTQIASPKEARKEYTSNRRLNGKLHKLPKGLKEARQHPHAGRRRSQKEGQLKLTKIKHPDLTAREKIIRRKRLRAERIRQMEEERANKLRTFNFMDLARVKL